MPVVDFRHQKNGHHTTPFSLSLATSVVDVGHHLARGALRRLGGLHDLEARAHVDAVILGRLLLERLLLRLHDVRQRGVARLVEAQVGGDDGRHLDLDGLQAAVDLARDRGVIAVDVERVRVGRLGPAGERRQHLAGGVEVVVDRLLAGDDETRLLLVDHRLQQLGDGQRLDVLVDVVGGDDEDRAVGAHGEGGAQRLLRLLHADGDGDDLFGLAGFLQADGLLDGDLVEGVHRHLDVGEVHTAAVRLHADLHVVVDDPFDGYENLHPVQPPLRFGGRPSAHRRRSTPASRTSRVPRVITTRWRGQQGKTGLLAPGNVAFFAGDGALPEM